MTIKQSKDGSIIELKALRSCDTPIIPLDQAAEGIGLTKEQMTNLLGFFGYIDRDYITEVDVSSKDSYENEIPLEDVLPFPVTRLSCKATGKVFRNYNGGEYLLSLSVVEEVTKYLVSARRKD